MNDERKAIELDIEVPGTPEEVWRAIATGPGISSWYVPHTVEEREGGAVMASFGPGPEMQVAGRVAAWEPPHRVVFDGGDVDGLAFEWLVEARGDGTCVVRLVNSGFGSGGPWDDQYDEMQRGWRQFLANLGLHLAHFSGQSATAMLPLEMWPGTPQDAWSQLMDLLGFPHRPVEGQRVSVATGAPALGGTVVGAGPTSLVLLLDEPAPGTALLAVERMGNMVGVSVFAYLYGEKGASAAAADDAGWRELLAGASGPRASHADA